MYVTVQVAQDEVSDVWQDEMGPYHTKTLAEHYGIYDDLFPGAYFLPVTPLHIAYDYDDEYVTPVYRGNRISPEDVSILKSIVDQNSSHLDNTSFMLLLV